jgi:type VI secretion system protein ImpG
VDVAAQWARAQPGIAAMAGAFASDPAQERVREGLLFLGASLIDQVGRLEADGHRSLADIVAPDVGRPFPSATIVELSSPPGRVVYAPAGAELVSAGETRCRFRLSHGIDVSSVRLQNCRVEPNERLSLRFSLVADGGQPLAASIGRSLRLFIDEPRESAFLLLHHLLSHTSRVDVRRSGTESRAVRGVRPFGMAEALLPPIDGVSDTASLVREYFLFPEKFLLLDVLGIQEALRPDDAKATVIFRFDAPLPQQVRTGPNALRANCTPAINLFPTTAEPRLSPPAATSFALRVAGLGAEESSVYEVLEVSATDPRSGATSIIAPVRRFGAVALDDRVPYAFTTQRSDELDPALVLSLTSPPDRKPVVEPHAFSVAILATNGSAGARVRPGELAESGAGMPRDVSARNVVPTSPYVPAPTPQASALRVVARGQVPRQDPRHVLQTTLYALLPSWALRDGAAAALTAKVDAIEAFDLRPTANRRRTQRGYAAILTIDDSAFNGLGDVALFQRVLHQVLDSRASLNRFFTTEVRCTKSGARLVWPVEGRS